MPIVLRRSHFRTLLLALLLVGGNTFAQSYSWQWGRAYSTSADEEVTAVATDNTSGAVYSVGYTKGSGLLSGTLGIVIGAQDAFVIKHDANGAQVWGFTPSGIGNSQATGITIDNSGNIYVCGWFQSSIDLHGNSALGTGAVSSSGNQDWFVASYAPDGTLRWRTTLGGGGNDRPIGIGMGNASVYVFGSIYGRVTTAYGTMGSSLPTGKTNVVIARFSLAGAGNWLLAGGSGDNEIPLAVAVDNNKVFVSYRAKNNTFTWYGTNGSTLVTHNNSTQWEVRTSCFTNGGAHQWTNSLREDNDSNIGPGALAAGCDALYITGITHSPCVFPGVGSVSTGTHDYLYVGRMSQATGNFQWVTTGTTTGSDHTIGGNSITIGKSGGVHIVGSFDEDLTIGGNTISNSNGKVLPYIASFRPTGTIASLQRLTSTKDTYGLCISADAQSNLVIGGRFETDVACGTQSLTGPSNKNGFVFKGSLSSLGGSDPSYWTPPAVICSNSGPYNLSTLLSPAGSGGAVSVSNSSGVSNSIGALGSVLGNYALFNTANGYVTVDLGVTAPIGAAISVLWRSVGGAATANILVGTATNPPQSTNGAITTSSTSAVYSEFQLTAPARYIRLTRPASGSVNFEVDGVYYSYGNDLTGIWSGPGVSGTTFNPAGLSGAIPLTYTVGIGTCASSTTASFQVTAAPNAGINGTLSTCSGSPPASLFAQLGGSPQTGGTWSGPSPVTGGMYDPVSMDPGTYTYTVAPTGVCAGAATASATVTVGASPSGGTFTGDGIVCPSPATGTLSISGYSGSIVRWAVSTNGGSTWSYVSSTSPSITWNNLTGPTQYKVELSQPGCGIGFSPTATLTPQDIVSPSLLCPPTDPVVTAYATSTCTMRVPDFRSYFTASDNCTATPSITQSPAQGTFVPFAANLQVIIQAADASGNLSGTCSATVIGVDTLAPVFACPADVVLNSSVGTCEASHTISRISYSDNCWGSALVEKVYLTEGIVSIAPLSIFDPTDWTEVTNSLVRTLAVGDHTIIFIHENGVEDIALCGYTVRVNDAEPPVIACGATVTLNSTLGTCTAIMPDLVPQVGAADNCGILSIVQDPAPGTQVSGSFNVTFTATDENGLSTDCQQSVSVVDPEPPTISCPPNIATATAAGTCTAPVNYAVPAAMDNCAGVSVSRIAGPASGSLFPLGSTTITHLAVDGNNNSVTCSFTVTVTDTDSDSDGTTDCNDGCPNDPNKVAPGVCGCGVSDVDTDSDGTADCNDGCPNDPNKIAPGICGCGVSDVDTDSDGTADCNDACPNDPNKIAPGICGCGVSDVDTDSDGTADCNDGCPNDPNKTAPGICGCGVSDVDSDSDGTADCNDGCPNDPNKIAPGICGCGVSDVDTDSDGTADCNDGCPNDPNKIAPGICGCGVSDVDTDSDGTADCNDGCPNDPNKIAPGICGCGVSDVDTDSDGTADCNDGCPNDPNKIAPGICGCGVSDVDTDSDGTADCNDGCPNDPNKIAPGICGCGVSDVDTDSDGTADCNDLCPADPNKIAPGICGCGVSDVDTDSDGTADCNDGCPNDPNKIAPGICGCGVSDVDTDSDGTADCNDGCPNDPNKIAPGICGCGVSDVDTDSDGTADCNDGCPADPNKIAPGICGCGVSDVDTDSDGTADCNDLCPADPNKTAPGICGCGVSDVDTDSDGTADCNDGCPNDPNKIAPGICGCGVSDVDTDSDGTADCNDLCPADPNKIAPGICGCGVSDVDTDSDGTADCNDGCPNDPNKVAPGVCGCGVSDVDTDSDGTADCNDGCPNDPNKVAPGVCGCGVSDVDTDSDGIADCNDGCPNDPNKVAPGICGCGVSDVDTDSDGTADCNDGCPNDPNKVAPGVCGCGVSDVDTDSDGTADCNDGCPNDPNKVAPGVCGCGVSDVDTDSDGIADCNDGCPNDPNKVAPGVCGCGVSDVDTDSDGTADCNDGCPNDPNKVAPGNCGCGQSETSCLDCAGVPNGSALPGTPCDDGIESTINDTWNSSCNCQGITVTCSSDAGPDRSTCEASIQLQASGIGSWTGPAGITFIDPTDPSTIVTASQPGSHELVWTVSVPGCTATDTMVATFNVGFDPAFEFAQNNICTNAMAPTPWVATTGGTFSSDQGLVIDPATGEVDPTTSNPGDYTVRHAFGGACPTQTERSISIVSTPVATWTVPDALCNNITPIDLNAMITGDPGGTWSGQGVTGHFFDPNGRVGENVITYVAEANGCTSSSMGTVLVVRAPIANAGPDGSVCGSEYVLSGTMSSGAGQWTAPSWIELVPTGPGSAIATNVALGTHQFMWTVTDGACTASDAVLITFLDPGTHLDVDAGPDQELEVVLTTFLNATVTPGASVQWSLLNGSGSIQDPNATSTEISGLSIGWNTFIITASLGQCVGDIDTVSVHIRDLFIPQGFSPNQDGDNDLFEVTGLGAYPGSTLTVFNRWGQKVYESSSYNNEWDGRSRNGQELPNDTYFYVLNLSGADTYNGFVVIKR